MFSLEPELHALRPHLGDKRADALIARERREVFSIYPELRIAGWLAAALLSTAAGVFLKNNLDRIGPLALAIGIGIAALACYAWAWVRRNRKSVVDDYVLLLGALLVSADVAFIESQFQLLGRRDSLVLLAVLHGVGAYAYQSRILLTLSLGSLAGSFGFSRTIGFTSTAVQAFEFAALAFAWRMVDRAARPKTTFSRTFEHFAANAALIGGHVLMDDGYIYAGGMLVLALAAFLVWWGFRTRHEPFVLYAIVYAIIAADWMILHAISNRSPEVFMFVIFASMVAAVAALLFLHGRFKEQKK